jgi:uncharacterized protein YndB with AHSA1/START domain
MSTEPQPAWNPNPTWMSVLGWIISILMALLFIASAVMTKFVGFKPPEGSTADIGWVDASMIGLGCVEIGCALIYLFPCTAVLGAVLLTGYLGGAIATHTRVGDLFVPQILFGVLIWFGVYLRDPRVRAVLPWRGDPTTPPVGGFLAGLAKFCLILLVVVLLIAALIAAMPAEFRVARSITIDAPPSKVFEHVNDFKKWEAWSPWLKVDPSAKVTIAGSPGKDATYKWSSDKNEGTMTVTESQPNELVRIKLEFVKPFPDTANSDFTFKVVDGKTVVTWSMYGERDFKGKAIGLIADSFVRGIYGEGLESLKEVVEKAK